MPTLDSGYYLELDRVPTVAEANSFASYWSPDRRDEPHFVIFWNGQPSSGGSGKPNPKEYRPGCVCVELPGGTYSYGDGGSYNAGCARWKPFSPKIGQWMMIHIQEDAK